MKRLLFDIETNGFLEAMDTVHSLVIRDLDSKEQLSCTDSDPNAPGIIHGLDVLAKAESIYGHNIIGFDLPAIQKVYPRWKWTGRIVDTLVLSRTRFAHLKEQDFERTRAHKLPSQYIGLHSLEAWGYRLGLLKDDYKDWCVRNGIDEPFAKWRQEMQDYCDQDVDVNVQLIHRLRRAGALSRDIIDMEHAVAWYLTQQERNGWPFDFEGAVRLQGELASKREELGRGLVKVFGSWVEKGKGFTPKANNSRHGYVKGAACTKLKLKEFNPASRQHIANRLTTLYGWAPEEFTPGGQAKVDESTLKGLDFPEAPLLVEYLTIDKRLGQLAEGKQAWMAKMADDRIEGGTLTGMMHIHHACSNVTITHRHRHSHPNVAQVPSIEAPYGRQCRALWRVPPGWKLLGADAAGLEARCLAHYMAKWDDGEYGRILLSGSKEEGTDVHSVNSRILGIPRDGADSAKTWYYAYLYGAGDEKLGSIQKPTANPDAQKRAGKQLRTKFESGLPALGNLVDGVKAKAKTHGYVQLIDGRRAYCRSPHSALNTLLQGTGSIICKKWIQLFSARLTERFGPQGWKGKWAALGWIHDEVQIAVRPEIAEEAAQIIVQSIRDVADIFKLRIPLDGDYSVGEAWHETH